MPRLRAMLPRIRPVCACLLSLGLLALAVGPTGAAENPGGEPTTPCRIGPVKAASPSVVRIGDPVTVSLTARPTCPPEPVPRHVALVIDASDSMQNNAKLLHAKRAANTFVDTVNMGTTQVAVVAFSDDPDVRSPLTSSRSQAKAAINSIRLSFGTNIANGVEAARDAVAAGRSRVGLTPFEALIILSDGISNPALGEAAIAAAAQAREEGMAVFSVCLGQDCETDVMEALASPGLFFESEGPELTKVYADIGRKIERVTLRELVVIDIVPPDMELDVASIEPPPDGVFDSVIRWRFRTLLAESATTMRYTVRPQRPGLRPTNEEASGVYFDTARRRGIEIFPVPVVRVLGPTETPAPTPEPTATAPPPTMTPTSEPSATPQTPTPSPSPSPTATATATVERSPRPAYLPALLASRCLPTRRGTDVILVVDASSSMLARPDPGGPTKLEAAAGATLAFLDTLNFPKDRAALVAFNDLGTVLQPLTHDASALREAVASITVRRGTRLDAGLSAAETALSERRPTARAVVILLTDGQPTLSSAAAALRSADRIKARDVTVYSIGLGGDVNPDLLRQMASSPDLYRDSPTVEDLAAIYTAIGEIIPCP